MLRTLWKFLAICVINLALSEARNDHLSREEFNTAIGGDRPFSVYYYGHQNPNIEILDKVLESIDMSVAPLTKRDLKIVAVNCDADKYFAGCSDKSKLHNAVMYRNNEIISIIPGKNLMSAAEITINILHHSELPSSECPLLTSVEDFEKWRRKNQGRRNLFIFYIPYTGSYEHYTALQEVSQLPTGLKIAYTMKSDLFHDDKKAWFFNLLTQETGEYDMIATNDVDRQFLESVERANAVLTLLPEEEFSPAIQEHAASRDILVLLTGKGVRDVALKIAKDAVSVRRGLKVLMVLGNVTLHVHLQPRVLDGKIFAMRAMLQEGVPKVMDMGYLDGNVRELLARFDEVKSGQDEIIHNLKEQEVDEEQAPYPENVLDDPMSFSLHHSGRVRELYYFDYKTIPRLTDITYDDVINSEDFAVILFTLEFNPRAIAALMTFVEIHNAYKESGLSSPMHRVECYNWPDVCEKAGVYTSPRLFFYPKGTSDRIEYSGLWDKQSIKDDIIRYSNPNVIVVRKKEDVLPYIPLMMRTLVGFFDNNEGMEEFRKASMMARKDYQFIAVQGPVREIIMEQYEVHCSHKTIIGFENGFPKEKHGTFTSVGDIMDYLKLAFRPPKVPELSIYSFVEIMKDPKPFLIYFWDQTNGNKRMELEQLKETIEDIATNDDLSGRMLFTWMDSSRNSVGEFVLKQYNHNAEGREPAVAFFNKKGSVILKSCGNCDNMTLITWLTDCLNGKVETTFGLNTEEWKPRLEGFDYLQFMRDEGTYPVNADISPATSENDRVIIPGNRKGYFRSIKTMKKNEEAPDIQGDMKKSMHEEL